MSSACVCHLELKVPCFYCEVYSPLERDFELKEAENAALKQEIEQIDEKWASLIRTRITIHDRKMYDKNKEIEQLKSDKAALVECLKWYGDLDHFSYGQDHRSRARECLAQIGETTNES